MHGRRAERRPIVFWTATGLIGLDTLLFTMVAPALPVFAEREGFSDTVAALIFAAYPVAQLATGLASAGLVERVGRRPLLIVAPCGLALATLAFALAGDPATLALARFAQGAAAGVVWTAALAAISDVYPSDQLGFRLGLAETVGGAIGLAGPLAGGAMVNHFGTTTAFASAAVLPLLAVLPILAVPETRRPVDPAQERIGVVAALRRVSGLPRARVAIVSLVVLAAVLALLEPLLPLDLDERLGLSPLEIGIVFAVGDLAYLACIAPAGRWSDRRGRRLPTLLGGVMVAAFLPLTAIGPAWFVALVVRRRRRGPGGARRVERGADGRGGRPGGHGRPLRAERGDAHRGVLGRLRARPAARRGGQRGAAVRGHRHPRGGPLPGGDGVDRAHPPARAGGHRGFGPRAKGKGTATLIPSPRIKREVPTRWSPCSPITRPTATSTRCSRNRTGRASRTSGSSAG